MEVLETVAAVDADLYQGRSVTHEERVHQTCEEEEGRREGGRGKDE